MVTAGPACPPAAAAVLTKRPAPMMAPMPSATRLDAPSVRFKPFSDSDAWSSKESKDFFLNKLIHVDCWFSISLDEGRFSWKDKDLSRTPIKRFTGVYN